MTAVLHRSEAGRAEAAAVGRPRYSVVIPTVGRDSLADLIAVLVQPSPWAPEEVVVVDDRPAPARPLPGLDRPTTAPTSSAPSASTVSNRRSATVTHRRTRLGDGAVPVRVGDGAVPVRVIRGRSRGPAAARNDGWLRSLAPWIAFLDDDVVPPASWQRDLAADLAQAGDDVVAVQGRVRVPLRGDVTDADLQTAALTGATWATADMAYRRRTLAEVGGFDERFPRAFREDADLGLRASRVGRVVLGARHVVHPTREDPWHISVRRQRGNADDALMDALHGPGWHEAAGAPRGRRPRHLVVTAAGLLGVTTALRGHRRLARTATAAWALGTAELLVARLRGTSRAPSHLAAMLATSVAIPPAASFWFLTGRRRARRLTSTAPPTVQAVLFDRDGTLVEDVPYNGDPDAVVLRPGAVEAVDRLRRAGVRVAMVSNQSGVARGLIAAADVDAVNARVASLLGGLDAVEVCPHAEGDGCECRKPAPGMVRTAARRLGVPPARCVVVGDIGSDVGAARAAGASAVLVPTSVTRPEEVRAAAAVAPDLAEAVAMVLSGAVGPGRESGG